MFLGSAKIRKAAEGERACDRRKEEIKETSRILLAVREMDDGKIKEAYRQFVVEHEERPKKKCREPERVVAEKYTESDLSAWMEAYSRAQGRLAHLRRLQAEQRTELDLEYEVVKMRNRVRRAEMRRAQGKRKPGATGVVIPRKKKRSSV